MVSYKIPTYVCSLESFHKCLFWTKHFIKHHEGIQRKITQSTWSWRSPQSSYVSLFLLFFLISNSCHLSRWCYLTTSSSSMLFSFCFQSFPTFPMCQRLVSGGQSIGASALATVLPMNIQTWFLLGLTDLISLKSKKLSRVLSSTTIQKHQYLSAQLSLWSNSHIHIWLLEKH